MFGFRKEKDRSTYIRRDKRRQILIYGLNFSPELTGVGRYTGELAELMASSGEFEVKVVTAPPYYPSWSVDSDYKNAYSVENLENLTVYRAPLYVPKAPTGIKRIIHLTSFALASAPLILLNIFRRPEMVIVIMPTFFCAALGVLAAKISGARSLIHVQDLELDAFYSLGENKPSITRKAIETLERFLFRRFDQVTTISHTMRQRIVSKGIDESKVDLFRNWVNLNDFDPELATRENAVISRVKEYCGIPKNSNIVLYAGNLGEKQGLEQILDAAGEMIDRLDISFLVVGTGARREQLKRIAQQQGLTNVYFHDLVEKNELALLLAGVDLHLVLQKKGMADLVMPSKLNAILSIGGHCLVMAERASELALMAENYPGVFTFVALEDNVTLAEAIEQRIDEISHSKFLSNPTDSFVSTTNPVARQFARERLDRDVIVPRFLDLVKELTP